MLENTLYRLRHYWAEHPEVSLAQLVDDINTDLPEGYVRRRSEAYSHIIRGTVQPQQKTIETIAHFLDRNAWPQPPVDMDQFAPIIRGFADDCFPKDKFSRLCGEYIYFQSSSREPGKVALGPMIIAPSHIRDPETGRQIAFVVTNTFQGSDGVYEHFEGVAVQAVASPILSFIMRNKSTRGAKFMLEREIGNHNPFIEPPTPVSDCVPFLHGQLYKTQTWTTPHRHFSGWLAIRRSLFPREPSNSFWYFADLKGAFPQLAGLLDRCVFTQRTRVSDPPAVKPRDSA